jgi:hypothetical protein
MPGEEALTPGQLSPALRGKQPRPAKRAPRQSLPPMLKCLHRGVTRAVILTFGCAKRGYLQGDEISWPSYSANRLPSLVLTARPVGDAAQ